MMAGSKVRKDYTTFGGRQADGVIYNSNLAHYYGRGPGCNLGNSASVSQRHSTTKRNQSPDLAPKHRFDAPLR